MLETVMWLMNIVITLFQQVKPILIELFWILIFLFLLLTQLYSTSFTVEMNRGWRYDILSTVSPSIANLSTYSLMTDATITKLLLLKLDIYDGSNRTKSNEIQNWTLPPSLWVSTTLRTQPLTDYYGPLCFLPSCKWAYSDVLLITVEER